MRKIALKSTVLVYRVDAKSITLRYCSELIHIDDDFGDVDAEKWSRDVRCKCCGEAT